VKTPGGKSAFEADLTQISLLTAWKGGISEEGKKMEDILRNSRWP
jgi:hypothetical protein